MNVFPYHAITNPLQEKANKGKGSIFDRMKNQISAAAATTASSTNTTGASASAQAAAALMKFSGFTNAPKTGTPKEPEKPVEDPVKEEEGQLSLDAAEQMLKWHAEAIGRCVVLSPPNEVWVPCQLKEFAFE